MVVLKENYQKQGSLILQFIPRTILEFVLRIYYVICHVCEHETYIIVDNS